MKEEINTLFNDPTSRITVLTGAGISAESGIPTFRGPEGYWTIGAREYQPQEMATFTMFSSHPLDVWQWYLYRMHICNAAYPNHAHTTLVEMETVLNDRFILITQNVDNLHLRAGSNPMRTLQIHGNVNFMRCSKACMQKIYPVPMELLPRDKDQQLSVRDQELLSCPDCGTLCRPHVLWFDEYYDEIYFKYDSAISVANNTDLLIIAGTSGATNLPNKIASIVAGNKKTIIDINLEENVFSKMALESSHGEFLKMSCSDGLEELAGLMR